jgi:hypothetical protein
MKVVSSKPQLSKEIATSTTSLMGKMGKSKFAGQSKVNHEDCIKSGSVKEDLNKIIKKY